MKLSFKNKFPAALAFVCTISLYFYFNKQTEQVIKQPDRWIMISNSEANMLNYRNGNLEHLFMSIQKQRLLTTARATTRHFKSMD